MRKTKMKVRFICLFLGITPFWSCSSDEKGEGSQEVGETGNIIMVFEDSVALNLR